MGLTRVEMKQPHFAAISRRLQLCVVLLFVFRHANPINITTVTDLCTYVGRGRPVTIMTIIRGGGDNFISHLFVQLCPQLSLHGMETQEFFLYVINLSKNVSDDFLRNSAKCL